MPPDSVIKLFSTHLRKALAKAMSFAHEFGHDKITSLHLLYGLAAEKGSLSSELLAKANFPVDLLKQELVRKHHAPYLQDQDNDAPKLDDETITILTKAVRTAQLHQHTYVGTEHALACLVNIANNELTELLELWHINHNELQRQVLMVLKSTSKFPDLTDTLRHLQSMQEELPEEMSDFPLLESIGKELTCAEYLETCPPLIGRDEEITRIQQILGRRYKNNPLLVGKPGVGKTAIIEGLARAILSPQASPKLRAKRVFSIELSSLVAGTMYRGEFEQRMKDLVEELKNNPEIILFIDEIHTLVGAGSTGQPLDAANILKPALARGEIRCIGATTWNEYQKHLAKDQALSRRFQTLIINEPNFEETKEILRGVKESFENFHQVSIGDDAIDEALNLSSRYLTHSCWPDTAIDLLDDASSQRTLKKKANPAEQQKNALKKKIAQLQKKKQDHLNLDLYDQAISDNKKLEKILQELKNVAGNKTRKLKITGQHIREAVALRTGMDVGRLNIKSEPIAHKILDGLKKTIIGQDEALSRISLAIQRGCSPMKEKNKPLGSYLFLGPSGVGKTATAKALAEELFGDEKAIIRLDMSEFSERFTVSKLIGAPAGYVGYQESGQLTNAIRQKPLSVVLFDEIEKAHPDIFNLLLQIFDEGHLQDNQGMTADFRHSVIILTSNLGLKELHNKVGFSAKNTINTQSIKSEMGSAVKEFFSLELLNRLDDIIYFKPLGIRQRRAIIKKKVEDLNNRLSEYLSITISENALKHISETAYNEEQGVRSIEKIIRETIEIPLSESMWKYKEGQRVKLDVEGDGVKLLERSE